MSAEVENAELCSSEKVRRERVKAVLADSGKGMTKNEIALKLMTLGYDRKDAEEAAEKFYRAKRSERELRVVARIALGITFLVCGVLVMAFGPVRSWGWAMLICILGIGAISGYIRLGL